MIQTAIAAERETSAHLLESFQRAAPVDIAAAARGCGVNVYAVDLGAKVAGVLRRGGPWVGSSGWVILVHAKRSLNRQRFTVAHELAHFLLHRPQIGARMLVEEDEFYRGFPARLEDEANGFAARALRPPRLIRDIMSSGVEDLPGIAERLGVSKQMLATHLGFPYSATWE